MLGLYALIAVSITNCNPNLIKTVIDNNNVEFNIAENENGECVPHGKWKEIYPSGYVRLIAEYKFGKRNGNWIWYRRNGKFEKTGEFEEDTESGLWQYYNNDGRLIMRGWFCSGKQCGTWTQIWDNGKTRSRITWQSGKINGRIINYYPNGSVSAIGQMNQDKRVGEWIWFDSFGNVIKRKQIN